MSYYGLMQNRAIQALGRNIKYLMVAVLVLSSLSYMKYSSFSKVENPVEHERAGLYLKKIAHEPYEAINVMSAKPYVNYYSNARFTMLPYANVPDVISFAKLYNVDYIVVDKRFLGKWNYYNELIEMQKYSDDVELFYEDSSYSLIKLFKIKQSLKQ